jgi:hypothetical protein
MNERESDGGTEAVSPPQGSTSNGGNGKPGQHVEDVERLLKENEADLLIAQGRRPSEALNAEDRTAAIDELRRAGLLLNGDKDHEQVLLDLYVISGRRLPNRVINTAEGTQAWPDATKTPKGREVLRHLRRRLEADLRIPEEDRSEDPYPEPEDAAQD